MSGPAIVWFRRDLRLRDNPALWEAADRGAALIPLFIWSPKELGPWPPGGAARWWLHGSLAKLEASLRRRHSRLILRRGKTIDVLRSVARATGADTVYWNRCYEPAAIGRDRKVERALAEDGIAARSFNGSLLFEPWEIATQQGDPYKVFTPFWRTCSQMPEPAAPRDAVPRISSPDSWPDGDALGDLGLEPKVDWAGGLRETWEPGEDAARDRLDHWLGEALAPYSDDRDRPAVDGTSRLSPWLSTGAISPRQIWHRVREFVSRARADKKAKVAAADAFLRELGWREFAYHLLFHFPHTPEKPLHEKFAAFPWRDDPDGLRAWQKGRTGFPIVDAGMRQLWHTGWMHNRVRMVAGSFLIKDLLLPWQEGARWFWDTLVDADLASNTLGWQWTAGSGADAAPFFRVFNPVSQGERFDPQGSYVRRWIPELADLPDKWVHKPWKAPAGVLADAGVEIGESYPEPIVDHAEARDRALEAFDRIR